jgi:hypothetical protein
MSQSPLIAKFIHCDAPNFVGAAMPVCRPAIESIEALGANVSGEDPEYRRLESQIYKVSARCQYKCSANATPPVVRLDVKSEELAAAWDVRIAGRSGRGETVNHTALSRHDRVGMKWIRTAKRVLLGAIFGAKLIEIVVGEESAVCGLPGAHVNSCDCHGIRRLGWTKEHG